MKIEILKQPGYFESDLIYIEQQWSWMLRADNGAAIASPVFYYGRRTSAIHSSLLAVGLSLPKRPRGYRSQSYADFPMRRGGFGDVYVEYGAGGMVKYAQWLVETEFIELVEA